MKYKYCYDPPIPSGTEEESGSYVEDVLSWSSSKLIVKGEPKLRTLSRYINLHLKLYAAGLILSTAVLAWTIIAQFNFAVISVAGFIALAFLDMVVTVVIDKKHSIKNGASRP
jgi:hypothetical protein